MDINLL